MNKWKKIYMVLAYLLYPVAYFLIVAGIGLYESGLKYGILELFAGPIYVNGFVILCTSGLAWLILFLISLLILRNAIRKPNLKNFLLVNLFSFLFFVTPIIWWYLDNSVYCGP